MKKLFFLLIAIEMMATTTVQAQTVNFINQIGCEIIYDVDVLADIILSSDTLTDDYDAIEVMNSFETTFQSKLGPDEPAYLVLVPDDDYFNVIFLQETKHGKIRNIFILTTEDDWLENFPHQRKNLRRLARLIRRNSKLPSNLMGFFIILLHLFNINL